MIFINDTGIVSGSLIPTVTELHLLPVLGGRLSPLGDWEGVGSDF